MTKRDAPGRGLYGEFKDYGREAYRGVSSGDFRDGVRRDLRDLYEFYVDEPTRLRLSRVGRFRRWLWQAAWLFRSLLAHLSPVRRLLLVIALALFVWGRTSQGSDTTWELPLSILILLLVLMLELKDKLLARDELEVGRSIQLSLLPDRSPELTGWDIWLYSVPANDVGGDLVDYLEVEPGRLAVFLGDVAGKGLGAALLMAKLQATLRALVLPESSMAEGIARLNRIFCRDGIEGRFATLVQLEFRESTGEVRIVNAGHMPPLVAGPTGVQQSEPVSLPIGIEPEESFHAQSLALEEGSTLIVFSDGVSETMNEEGTFFGEDRIRELVAHGRGRTARELGEEILRAVDEFRGERRLDDDLSLVVACRRRPS